MKRIIVHAEHESTNVALLDDAKLVEYFTEKPSEGQVGSIFKGKVVNVLPGMQAAFVDIGQSRNAFLYVDDLLAANLNKQPEDKPSITDLVREGQEILVQVTKEASGSKGARVTTHFSLPGRWIVYMPNADYIGVSRKIESLEERNRLKDIGDSLRIGEEGFIMRTVAEGATTEQLQGDLLQMRDLWRSVLRKADDEHAASCIFRDLDMLPRLIRDIFTEQIDELLVDDEHKMSEIVALLQSYSPQLADRVHLYRNDEPIMRHFHIPASLEKSFHRKVWLDNGAYLMIDHTEALTVIDVNTGKFTGDFDLEQTVFETNVHAAEEIARLIRLRDLGGIIIIDFIDMSTDEHRQQVMETMQRLVRDDRTKSLVVGWTQLGLLEMTRKKVRDFKQKLPFEPCPTCNGSGKTTAARSNAEKL